MSDVQCLSLCRLIAGGCELTPGKRNAIKISFCSPMQGSVALVRPCAPRVCVPGAWRLMPGAWSLAQRPSHDGLFWQWQCGVM